MTGANRREVESKADRIIAGVLAHAQHFNLNLNESKSVALSIGQDINYDFFIHGKRLKVVRETVLIGMHLSHDWSVKGK